MNMYDIDVKPTHLTVFGTIKTAWARLCANIPTIVPALGCIALLAYAALNLVEYISKLFDNPLLSFYKTAGSYLVNPDFVSAYLVNPKAILQSLSHSEHKLRLAALAICSLIILALFIGLPLAMYTQYTLDIYDQKKTSWKRMYHAAKRFIPYTGTILLRSIIVGAAFFLFEGLSITTTLEKLFPSSYFGFLDVLLIGAIFWIAIYWLTVTMVFLIFGLAPFLVIEKKNNAIVAMVKSLHYVKWYVVRLYLLGVTVTGILTALASPIYALPPADEHGVLFYAMITLFCVCSYAFIDLIIAHVYRFFVPKSTVANDNHEYSTNVK